MLFCDTFRLIVITTLMAARVYVGRTTKFVSRTDGVHISTSVLYTPGHRPIHSLFTPWRTVLLLGRCGNFFRPNRRVCLSTSLVALLLLMSGVESNPGPQFLMGMLNAHSVVRKGPLIQEMITSHSLDALAICESWICADDPDAIKLDSAPSGFSVMHVPRPSVTHRNRGGGLCFIHRNELTVRQHPLQRSLTQSTFECQLLSISSPSLDRPADKPIVLANIYRPPSSTIPPDFYDEISDLLLKVGDIIDADRFVMCGDFNCSGSNSTVDAELIALFEFHGLQQHVTTPTHHTAGTNNILDLVVGPTGSDRIASVRVHPSHDVSDHDLVKWSINKHPLPPRLTQTYSFRNIKSIDLVRFQEDLTMSRLFSAPEETASKFAEQIDTVTSEILDAHCPLQTRTKLASSSSHQDNRWLSPDAISANRERRRLERLWKSRGREDDRAEYRKACRRANKEIIASRRQHYTGKIQAAGSSPRRRWSAIRELLHSTQPVNVLPGGKRLCETFASFFDQKINSIKAAIASKLAGNNSDALRADGAFNGEPLRDLQPPTVEEVRKLISAMPSKSSPIDSIPTSILKSCSDVFSLLITRLATLSFHEGSFPDSYKTASVTPLLKKKDSDRDDPANFRPISNLHTISKLLERLVLSRIMPHVENSPNFNRFQSAYRRGYSTESAILRMLNDVYCAADRKRRSMIVLLDLSAAFDTIDIDTLLRRLEHTFGITGSALLWMKTYLEDRTQFVRIGDDRSGSVHCRFGVPQGSVLGPALFSTYVAPIAGVISSFGVHHTQYADDTQLYIELRDNAVTSLDNCFRAVHQWFIENGLALNPGKSEVIVTGTGARIRQEGRIEEMTLGDTPISVSNTVKSLGVTIDETLSFNNHVDNVCKASFFHIKALRHIRRCIDEDTARTVAGSIVGSRIDYCNSILHGTSASNLNKIQRVINTLARVVTGTGRREHITPVLKRLHWLPVRSRITIQHQRPFCDSILHHPTKSGN